MLMLPPGTRIYLCTEPCDMPRLADQPRAQPMPPAPATLTPAASRHPLVRPAWALTRR